MKRALEIKPKLDSKSQQNAQISNKEKRCNKDLKSFKRRKKNYVQLQDVGDVYNFP